MAESVFKDNEEFLKAAKDEVKKRDDLKSQSEELKLRQKKLSKAITVEEKSIADEISSTIKKRKSELEKSFDERLDDNRSRKKKVSNKRDRKKNQRVNERIEDETKHISRNTRELDTEIKTLFKKNKIPTVCASKLYYIMFSPSGVSEILLMFLCFLIYLMGIPSAVTFIIKKSLLEDKKDINMAFWVVLIMAVLVIIQLVIYFLIFNATKNKHREVIAQGRSIWNKKNSNKKQAQAIKQSISKDKDESIYNLEAFDEKLAELDKEADAISDEKQAAIKSFEDETIKLITDEINGRRLEKLNAMKQEKHELEDSIAEMEKKYSEQVLLVTKQYAPYLGEEFCRQDKLTDLITLIEEGQASTVSEAVNIYKGTKSSK